MSAMHERSDDVTPRQTPEEITRPATRPTPPVDPRRRSVPGVIPEPFDKPGVQAKPKVALIVADGLVRLECVVPTRRAAGLAAWVVVTAAALLSL